MRYAMWLKAMVPAWLLIFSLSAMAANTASFRLAEAAQLNGKQIASGEYTVKWDGQASDVQVSILRGKKVVATAPAKLVDSPYRESNSTVVLHNAGGVKNIQEMRFRGKKQFLVFASGAGGESAQGSIK